MTDLLFLPPPGSRPALIIHAGAGVADWLPGYLEADAVRIVVIDPDEVAATRLSQAHAGDGRIEVIHAALTPRMGPVTRRRFNFPDLDSLSEPTGLLELFPGLRERGRDVVPALAPSDLARRFGAEPGNRNWLVIDMPGEEAAILRSLFASGGAELFETVLLRGGQVPLYEEAHALEAVEALLAESGYTTARQAGGADPSRPLLRVTRDSRRIALERDLAAASAALQESQAEAERRSGEAAQLRAALEDAKARLASDAAVLTSAQTRIADLEAALRQTQERLRTVEQERDAALTEVKAAEDRNGVLQRERNDARDETARLRASLEVAQSRLTQVETAQEAARKSAKADTDKTAAERDRLREKLDVSRAELLKLEGQIDVIRAILLQQGSRL